MSCNQHDYIEIVCMYRFLVKLTLKSGAEIEGVALDTDRNTSKAECINIEVDGSETLVLLDAIRKMEVLVENPHFQVVYFD